MTEFQSQITKNNRQTILKRDKNTKEMASSSNEEIIPDDQGDFAPSKDRWHNR